MGLEEQLRHATDHRNRAEHERTPTLRDAWQIVGGLSRTTKMPCHSWGLPARACITGANLASVAGSVCHGCYARSGNYTWPRVVTANERRLAQADHPDWTAAMRFLVEWQARKNRQPFFRWFDTGDLQSASMLERIVHVATTTPNVQHWLPTKEHNLVNEYLARHATPDNLTIRISAVMTDGAPPDVRGLPTSTVHRHEPPQDRACPAYRMQPARCGPCRDCWNPAVQNVSYPLH